jgi:hypothetical protein
MHHGVKVIRLALVFMCLNLGLFCARGFAEQVGAWPEPVGVVPLNSTDGVPEYAALDVGLVLLDPGIPEDESTHSKLGIFPQIRKVESQFMSAILRQVLENSGGWGVVRVLPEALDSSELLINGRILHSDGLRLALHIQASDGTGRRWLDRVYVDETVEGDYPVVAGSDPYIDLYHRIANDLLAIRKGLDEKSLRNLRETALLRYAAALSPEAFSGYLSMDETGRYTLARLPARGDPMMARVQSIRNQEFLFIDTVDEQYVTLYEEMAPTYNLWRQYGREQAIYKEEYQERLANRDSAGRRGSFAAMQQAYGAYKWSKVQEQDLDELALGFDNELAPTVMEVSGRVFRLNGTLESQYSDWREILRSIFALEMGLPAQ